MVNLATLEAARKTELRAMCKENGIKNYGLMDNQKMRDALRMVEEAHQAALKVKQMLEAVKSNPEIFGANGLDGHCPSCECYLHNGDSVGKHGDVINGTVIEQEREYECLNCEYQWGNKVEPIVNVRKEQNGIVRPQKGITLQVWEACEKHFSEFGKSPLPSDLMYLDINEHTIRTQYARWRKFNGIVGRAK